MVYTITNKLFISNTYLVTIEDDSSCIIIDPGLNFELAEHIISEHKLLPIVILCTHGHFDHIANVSFFQEKYQIPFYIHEKDLRAIKSANFFLRVSKNDFTIKTPVPDVLFKEEITDLTIGNLAVFVRNFPGHSPGSCIIQIGNNLFSGDTIYKKGLGFNCFPDENKEILKQSLRKIFVHYSHESRIYPGHGSSELLGSIFKNNHELIEFLSQ